MKPEEFRRALLKCRASPVPGRNWRIPADKVPIDAEFAALIPKQTRAELAELERDLRTGCREPLTIWTDVRLRGVETLDEIIACLKALLDGHTRLAVCRTHGIPFEVRLIYLPDRAAARDWIIRSQSGRRNLKPDALSYYRGKRYLELRHQGERVPATSGNSCQKLGDADSPTENGDQPTTAEMLAAEYKTSARTIRNDAKFAEAVDAIVSNCGAEVRGFILCADCWTPRNGIIRIANLPADEQKKQMEALMHPEGKKNAKRERAERTPDVEAKEIVARVMKGGEQRARQVIHQVAMLLGMKVAAIAIVLALPLITSLAGLLGVKLLV